MKNKLLFGLLVFSLFHFVSCTTLSGSERCALIGQIHEGTQIGTQTNISSSGSSIYSYHTPSYNPICKRPKTSEEKATVAELLPIAQEKRSQRAREQWIAYGGLLGILILAAVVGGGS